MVLWGYTKHDRHIAGDTHIPSDMRVWGYTNHRGIHITVTPDLAQYLRDEPKKRNNLKIFYVYKSIFKLHAQRGG